MGGQSSQFALSSLNMMMKEYLELKENLGGVEKKKRSKLRAGNSTCVQRVDPVSSDVGNEYDLVIGAIFYCCLVTSVSHQICLV